MSSHDLIKSATRALLIVALTALICRIVAAQVSQIAPPQGHMHHGTDRGQIDNPPHP
jgi:hypothetical protein